jgi:hypothetical protein
MLLLPILGDAVTANVILSPCYMMLSSFSVVLSMCATLTVPYDATATVLCDAANVPCDDPAKVCCVLLCKAHKAICLIVCCNAHDIRNAAAAAAVLCATVEGTCREGRWSACCALLLSLCCVMLREGHTESRWSHRCLGSACSSYRRPGTCVCMCVCVFV